jgi:hypothetical protein
MRSQAVTAFGTTAFQNKAACLGAHANAETMGFRATAIIRLKSALHCLSP